MSLAIIADTIKGKGLGFMELNVAWHVGGALEGDDYENAVREIHTPRVESARKS